MSRVRFIALALAALLPCLGMQAPPTAPAPIANADTGSTSFWAAQNRGDDGNRTLGILERQRVKVWLRNAYEEVDRAGV